MTAASPTSVAAANRGLSAAAVYALVLFVRPTPGPSAMAAVMLDRIEQFVGTAVAHGNVGLLRLEQPAFHVSIGDARRQVSRPTRSLPEPPTITSRARMHRAAEDRVGHDFRRIEGQLPTPNFTTPKAPGPNLGVVELDVGSYTGGRFPISTSHQPK